MCLKVRRSVAVWIFFVVCVWVLGMIAQASTYIVSVSSNRGQGGKARQG